MSTYDREREPVMEALFALGSAVQWDTPGRTWKTTSRRLKLWTECPAQPALYQVEHNEDVEQITGMPYKEKWLVDWVVYQNIGRDTGPDVVPSRENNLIMDAIRRALAPDCDFDDRQTLGGLVHHCFVDGRVFRDAGDLDGQGVITIPITILVP